MQHVLTLPRLAPPTPRSFVPVPRPGAGVEPQARLDELRARYRQALHALAVVGERADRAERRLRSRLLERGWVAALGGFAGGFATMVALRLAGL